MARYNQLLDDVRSSAPECPDRVVEHYIRRAVIAFIKQSRVWRESIDVALAVGRDEYELRADGRVDQVINAVYVTDKSRRHITHVPFGRVDVPERRSSQGEPRFFGVDPSGQLVKVSPVPGGQNFKPDQNPRLEVRAVLVPSRNSRQFPDFVFEHWYEGLVSGALWMLLGTTSKPWTNSELAGVKAREFFDAVRNAKQAAAAEGWAPMRPRYRRWV